MFVISITQSINGILGFTKANNFYLIETKDQIHFYNR